MGMELLKKAVGYTHRYGICHTVRKIVCKLYINYFEGVFRVNRRLSRRQRNFQKGHPFSEEYLISILVPLYNTPERFLREMIDSVLEQTYGKWQLCMADGSDECHGYVGDVCRRYAKKDARVAYRKLQENKGISENTNVCVEMAEGEYLALFDHDDVLHPSALFEVMAEITGNGADFVYTDEATFSGRETHLLSVHRKPDFYMENLRANNYICHFTVFKKDLLEKSGMFRKAYDGSQDYDLILRLCENAVNIRHIPKVLYFWRAHSGSVAQDISSKEYAVDAGLRAVEAHLRRQEIPATVEKIKDGMTIYRVRYQMEDGEMEKLCVLREGEEEKLEAVREDSDIQYILLLKSGLECPAKEGVKTLLSHMVKPQTAAVTGKIIGKNGKIWSAGVSLNEQSSFKRQVCAVNSTKFDELTADDARSMITGVKESGGKYKVHHLYRGVPANEPGYMNRLLYPTGIPAICNGCMVIRKECLGGVSADRLFSMEEWVGLCVRLWEAGYDVISEPEVEIRQFYSKIRVKRRYSLD